jgi:hypothetical protein
MNVLSLEVESVNALETRRFAIKRMVNAGYVGRNREAILSHIRELEREGIAPPPEVPMIFPVHPMNLTTAEAIEVAGEKTSGEVEYVLLIDHGEILVGVGSDHTDREVESHSIVMSKQVCFNVMSGRVWRYADIDSGWDEMLLQSWVTPQDSSQEVLYQKAHLGSIISSSELIARVQGRMRDEAMDGLVVFSGTIPILTEAMIYGSFFRIELFDPIRNRALGIRYRVQPMDYLRRADESSAG